MRTVTLTFEPLAEQTLHRLGRATTVFVMWDPAESTQPAAIGAGDPLAFFLTQPGPSGRVRPINGYVAFVRHKRRRTAAKIAARAARVLADGTHSGSFRIRGRNPLIPPA